MISSRPSHRLALSAPLVLVLTLPAAAQQAPVSSLLDLLSPDRIAARLLQSAVVGLRSVADVSYDGLSTSLLARTATITGLQVRPYPGIDDFCEFTADRVWLAAAPMQDLDHIRLQARLSGATLGTACLADELSSDEIAGLVGEVVHLSDATLDLDYTLSTGAVAIRGGATAEGLVGLRLDVELDSFVVTYVQGTEGPLAELRSARLEVGNRGLWEKLQPMLPPMVTDADMFAALVDEMLSDPPEPEPEPEPDLDPGPTPGPDSLPPSAPTPDADADEGDESVDRGWTDPPSPAPAANMPPERAAFAESLKTAWARFLQNPDQLVLETGFDGTRWIELEKLEDADPDELLALFEPRLRTVAGAVTALLPAALLEAATQTPGELSEEERLRVGRALATGQGAPRDLAGASKLLGAAVDAGSSAAAVDFARAFAATDPQEAYSAALLAAQAGEPGAAALLDRVEALLGFDEVQKQVQDSLAERQVGSLQSLRAIRDEMRMHLSGKGRLRSYAEAALWATLGAAAGDSEAAAVLAQLEGMAQMAGAEGLAAWRVQEREAAELARSAWVGFDLPQRLSGQ